MTVKEKSIELMKKTDKEVIEMARIVIGIEKQNLSEGKVKGIKDQLTAVFADYNNFFEDSGDN